MKTVYIVFNDREKSSVSSVLFQNLQEVFENYIEVKTCFLDELDDTNKADIADGDLFLVLYKDRVYSMRNYITSLDKVIVLSRTIQKKFLPNILDIPEDTNVLVVNDSYESTLQTANTLYELGINHLNLIPFEEGLDYSKYYDQIEIAITPNEISMVPAFIKKVINVDDRYIDLNTFTTIINKLRLNHENVTRNLIRYTALIAGTDMGFNQKYIESHLKSEMLKKVIHNASEAILLTDHNNLMVYANDKAETLFGLIDGMRNINLFTIFEMQGITIPSECELNNWLVNINGSHYMVNKNPIMILDQTVGYSIMLNSEQDIKNIENDFNQQLIKTGLVAKYSFEHIICRSKHMDKCIALAKKAALTDFAVLISGESGTGKELMAQSIHTYSPRSNHAFVAINCAALPEPLLESELFGYEKGAFTGALNKGKLGLFEQANKGTIFLDEIGDMSLSLQARLLRVLQEKQIMRLGSDRVIDIDIRILAATNKDLKEEVQKNHFRQDLYYRLCNIPIVLPPLRDRKEDISLLMYKFLGTSYVKVKEAEWKAITAYHWPGNVRELENVANYYTTLGELPESIYQEEHRGYQKDDQIEYSILDMIKQHTTDSCGIGRITILRELEKVNILLSDDKLRQYLKKLATMEYILTGRGRIGSRITKKGQDVLEHQNV